MAALLATAIAALETNPPRRAVVTGGILHCQALPEPGAAGYDGGTVTVLKGDVGWVLSAGPESLDAVFPNRVVATERVPAGGRFQFILEPGDYVLTTAPGPAGRYATATVGAGDDVVVDIPNGCI